MHGTPHVWRCTGIWNITGLNLQLLYDESDISQVASSVRTKPCFNCRFSDVRRHLVFRAVQSSGYIHSFRTPTVTEFLKNNSEFADSILAQFPSTSQIIFSVSERVQNNRVIKILVNLKIKYKYQCIVRIHENIKRFDSN